MIFDGDNRLIILENTLSLDVVDLYSRWKDWVLDADNSKYLPAFKTVGGEPIDAMAGTSVPLFAFLTNGWRLRPFEASYTLVVSGGVLLVEDGGDPFVDTIDPWTVRINYQNPVQAIVVNTGGGGGTGGINPADIDLILRNSRQILALVAASDPSIVIASGGVVQDATALRLLRAILAPTASQ